MKCTTPVLSENPPLEIDDLPRRLGLRPQPLHQACIVAVGNEADVLTVGFGRDLQSDLRGDPSHLVLWQIAQWKAQEVELLARGPVEEVALVSPRVGALVQLDATVLHDAPHIMARRQAIRPKLARESDEVHELHPLVAARARDRRAPVGIFIDEAVDHAFAEAGFVVEHVVGDPETVRDLLGIVDVLPRAARAGAPHRLAVIVELERHPDHVRAGPRGERGGHRAVDSAGHRDDDSGLPGRPIQVKADGH